MSKPSVLICGELVWAQKEFEDASSEKYQLLVRFVLSCPRSLGAHAFGPSNWMPKTGRRSSNSSRVSSMRP